MEICYCLFSQTQSLIGTAQIVMNAVFLRTRQFAFTEILRVDQRLLYGFDGLFVLLVTQVEFPQLHMSEDILACYFAFTTFPWVEFAFRHQGDRFFVLF